MSFNRARSRQAGGVPDETPDEISHLKKEESLKRKEEWIQEKGQSVQKREDAVDRAIDRIAGLTHCGWLEQKS